MRDTIANAPVEQRATLMNALDQLEGVVAMAESLLHGNPPTTGPVNGQTPMPSNLVEVARMRVNDATERVARIADELRAL